MAWSGKVGVDFVGSIVLTDGDGAPDTGLAAELSVTVQNPADSAASSLAVAESSQIPGLYLFTVPGAFLAAAGQYGVLVTKTTVPRATVSELLDVKANDVDDVKADTARLRYLGSVWIDTANGSPGDVVDVNGLPGNPSNNLADALEIADLTGLRSIVIVTGNLVLTRSLTEFRVELRDESEIDLNGQSVNGSEFVGGEIKGAMSGVATFRSCHMEDVNGLRGHAQFCGFVGVTTLGAGHISFDLCHSAVPGPGTPTIVFGDPTSNAGLRGWMGGVQIEGMTLPAHILSADVLSGQVVIDSSCSGGTRVVRGRVQALTNNETGGTTLTPHIEELDWLKNRRRIDFAAGPPRQLVLYEQDGVTEKARMDLTTVNGTEVLPFFGTQHERGAPT